MSGKIILDNKIRSLFKSLKNFGVLKFAIVDNGVMFQASDVAATRAHTLFLSEKDFDEFNLSIANCFIDYKRKDIFLDFIITAKQNIVLHFIINELTEQIDIRVFLGGTEQISYGFDFDPDARLIEVKEKSFETYCVISTKVWEAIVKNLSIYEDRGIVFRNTQKALELYTTVNQGEEVDPKSLLRYSIRYGFMSEALSYELNGKEEVITAISIDFLTDSIKTIKFLDTLRIDISHRQPMRIQQKIGLDSYIIYVFAPMSKERVN